MTVWTVKSGAKGEAEERSLKDGLIGKGSRVASIEGLSTRDEVKQLWAEAYPEMSNQQTQSHAAQLWTLLRRVQVGDLVVLSLKTTGTIAVGRVTGHTNTDRISAARSSTSDRSNG